MMNKTIAWIITCLIILLAQQSPAQERIAPLSRNGRLAQTAASSRSSARGTAVLTLPFFEDFTDPGPYPNGLRWADSNVYINNNMTATLISRGIATFDALNKLGRPRDTVNANAVNYGDTLTSLSFDLSSYQPSDNIYLSFFYQPQGLGFAPEIQDSLMLLFRQKSGGYAVVWSTAGGPVQAFRQAIIPVRDTSYLFAGFQFRFIAKASINTNDDIWNVDYIRMAANRSPTDTAVNDLAFTTPPTNLLNDYTAMPYRHFLANVSGEQAASFSAFIANRYSTNATVNYGFMAREAASNFPLSGNSSSINMAPYSQSTVIFPNYTAVAPATGGRIVFENKFFLQSGNPNEPKENDTIIHNQVFDNYFAYDDGSAEKSYYLNLLSTLPGKTAIEFRTNVTDTLQGIAIYFGQQVPTAFSKLFSIAAYKELEGVNGATQDVLLAQRNNLTPLYTDSINRFTIYKFDQPVLVNTGYFYVGYIQPANSGSDSLYIGLDVARTTANHLYFNVLDRWESSAVSGALMVRPLMGRTISGTVINTSEVPAQTWEAYPNPATSKLYIRQKNHFTHIIITDIMGRKMLHTRLTDGGIPLVGLASGTYFVRLGKDDYWTAPHKIIKQ
jgi:hypothetical protein